MYRFCFLVVVVVVVVVFVLFCLFLFLGQLITADYNSVSFLAYGFQCSRIFSQSIRRNLQYLSVLKY